MASPITETNLENFKKLVRKAIFLTHDEEVYFNSVPDKTWEGIFRTNFHSNFNYAQRVLLNKFKDIEKIDTPLVEAEKNKIANLDRATQFITKAIDDKSPILFITDFDNDGSLAQSIINEYLKIDVAGSANMHVEYAQTVNGNSNRGFTVDLVDKIVTHKGINPDQKFLIVTADNGINSLEEQKKIQARFPNAEIVVTDHHNPDAEMVVAEDNKTVIFNPHYKPTKFFQEFNISGANTISVLLKNVLRKRYTPEQLEEYKTNFETISKLCKVSNLLDYVHTHPADKPEKDYVITRFLQLQPLLNINNSISKIITGEVPVSAIKAIKEKIPNLNSELIYEEANNIHIQNDIAKVLLSIYDDYRNNTDAKKKEELTEANFNLKLIAELNKSEHFQNYDNINPNYIEQLRPLIFGLSADDTKTTYLDALNKKMIAVFESIKISEKAIAEELRAGEVVTKHRLDNSVIVYTDKNILSIFNRKFLNKVYNDENPGFSLTLDSIDKAKVSGSFRSLYDISDILKDKEKLEKQLNVKIETPGHERAAGFILKSLNPETQPITEKTIAAVNTFINNSIAQLKENEIEAQREYLLTDLSAIALIDRINRVIRGNISNFERLTPLLKLTPDTVWTDSYTTQQYSMKDIVDNRKYGYISINTNFHGDTVIVPIELIRKIVKNDYKDYLQLNYMDGGVFMAEKIVSNKDAANVIDLRNKNAKTQEIKEVFAKDFKDKNYVHLNRDQIRDNPFFKYHDYGNLNFDLFERMVIGIIDSNRIDTLAVFDVEANGFGNSKLMNFGAMNYVINKDSGESISSKDFIKRFYYTQRGEEYLLTLEQVVDLKEVSLKEAESLPLAVRKQLLRKNSLDEDEANVYWLHPDMESNPKKKKTPFLQVRNYIANKDGTVTYNREVQATMLAYLVKDKDFKVPQEMTNLTGITQEVLDQFGTPTSVVDKELTEYYQGKKVLFGAHNTPYDARVLRANTPNFYEVLKSSYIYDSALFSREEKLAYDYIKVANFEKVEGLPANIFFYNNAFSEFNLTNFIEKNNQGYYPDRTNQYLLEIDGDNFYLVDKVEHEKVKIQATKEELMNKMLTTSIPNTSVKYSVEKLSEQWMIHSLLLSDEKFDIQHVDIEKYPVLKKHEEAALFLQDNYHFDTSLEDNYVRFKMFYFGGETIISEEENNALKDLLVEFLEINKSIQQKFSDAWMYKQVLTIKDPNRQEVTNDTVDLVHYQTNIPKEKIRTIFDEAIKFKEKYKIDHILQHEGHINGPWESDTKGDVAFEDKLTLSLLAQRMYDSYDHEVHDAIQKFNSYSLKARLAFDVADNLSDDLANDSYSYRQGLLYNRDIKTKMISGIQEKENNLLDEDTSQVIKFKLGNDVLPQDSAVYGITRKSVSVSRQDIEEDNKKLAFIVLNEQIRSSMKNLELDEIQMENIKSILEANNETCMAYKADLSKHYRYVEYNRKDYQMKKLLESAIKSLQDGSKMKATPSNEIDQRSFDILDNILDNYVANRNRLADQPIEQKVVDDVRIKLEEIRKKCVGGTSLERAIENSDTAISDFTALKDANFLSSVDINRRDPLKILLDKHQKMRLLNNFIQNSHDEVLEQKQESGRKLRM